MPVESPIISLKIPQMSTACREKTSDNFEALSKHNTDPCKTTENVEDCFDRKRLNVQVRVPIYSLTRSSWQQYLYPPLINTCSYRRSKRPDDSEWHLQLLHTFTHTVHVCVDSDSKWMLPSAHERGVMSKKAVYVGSSLDSMTSLQTPFPATLSVPC